MADGYLDFVTPCTCCSERWCTLCDEHWADCECSGPHDDEGDQPPPTSSAKADPAAKMGMPHSKDSSTIKTRPQNSASASSTGETVPRKLTIRTTRIRGGHVADLLHIVTSPNFDPKALGIAPDVTITTDHVRHFEDGRVLLDRYAFTNLLIGVHVELRAIEMETVEGTLEDWCSTNGVVPCQIR